MTAAPDYQHPEPGERESIANLLNTLARTVRELDREVNLALEYDTDAQRACELLLELREAVEPLRLLTASVEANAAQRMSRNTLTWPGFVAERKGGKDRREWRHDEIAWQVIRNTVAQDHSGELPEDVMAVAARIRDVLVNCAGIMYWRASQLRPLGVDPDDYSTTVGYRRTVQVRRDVPDGGAA